ncbi:oxidoreductase [Vibrio sp. CAU 1672]|uniref:oxidoreductase n=1 Tax=Vibrio sp. CAU 1672 TaxID=3032594 RepID=UPI0023DAE334|nr:oxidoreductase [Vibrio sp. CAU 1672]MDF2155838.1 oxidoreductase [Vibrio sp. CAU 1672]
MRVILSLLLLILSPLALANTIEFSSPNQTDVALSRKDIEALPATTYTTPLPWIENPAEFLGVKLSTLLEHVYGRLPEKINIGSLNDYHAVLSKADILRYQPIVAYQQDKHYIRIRDKGPYWIIYPLSRYPELDTSQYHAQMVWQVNTMSVEQ